MRASLFLSLLLPALLHAQTADWPDSRGNAAMTGTSPVELKFPLELAWQFKLMDKPKGQPEMLVSSAVVRNGKVYLGSKDGKFFCLDLATGTVKNYVSDILEKLQTGDRTRAVLKAIHLRLI